MSTTPKSHPFRRLGVLALASIALAGALVLLAALPGWLAPGETRPLTGDGVLLPFPTPAAVAILLLSFPVIQYLVILSLRAWLAFNRSLGESGLVESKGGVWIVVLGLFACLGLQLVFVLLLFGSLGWFPVLLILLGMIVSVVGALS
ncbi:MAG: hypothetical protein ACLFU2_06830 [Opitutales bacterium]